MRIRHHFFTFTIFCGATSYFFCGCQPNNKEYIPLTALETAQQFLRLEMSGNYKNATENLLANDYNQTTLSIHQKEYEAMSEEQKKQLKSDIINILSYNETSDSTAILDYSNTIDTAKQRLYLIRQNKKWLIDFKNPNPSK